MHELSVVFSVIKTVEETASAHNVRKVNAVTIRLGEVSTVIPHYLTDCWNWAVRRTQVLQNAELRIETIPAVTYCRGCGDKYPTVTYGRICPHCGSPDTFLLQGNEFLIHEIEAEEEETENDHE